MAMHFKRKGFYTRSGLPVIIKKLKKKYIGYVIVDELNDVVMPAMWDLNGLKINLFPRDINEIHDLDLVMIDDEGEYHEFNQSTARAN